jgi:hypothetical protein
MVLIDTIGSINWVPVEVCMRWIDMVVRLEGAIDVSAARGLCQAAQMFFAALALGTSGSES